MRIWLPLLLLLALGGSSVPAPTVSAPIVAVPLALDPRDPGQRGIGALTFVGGWHLTSRDPRFGGVSSMIVDDDGHILAIGDRGGIFRLDARGDGVTGRVIGTVPDGPPTIGKRFGRDIESLTRDPLSGRLWLGYEAWNAVWRFDPMTRLDDGRFLIFCEKCEDHGGRTEAVLFASDPAMRGAQAQRLRLLTPPGYSVTDARLMPNGRDLLLLERQLSLRGFSAILATAPLAAFVPGAAVRQTVLAEIAIPLAIDNMEALGVSREGANTIAWIASDDNFSVLQRTLLLKFRIGRR